MAYYFGLHFGDTNLCIAVFRDGNYEVLANAAGDRVTPSFLAFSNGEKVVGLPAKQGMVRNSTNTLTMIKTLVGGNDPDIEEVARTSKCKIIKEKDWKYEVEMEGRKMLCSPYDALVSLFKNMATIAKSNCHEENIPVVVTVPLSFDDDVKDTVRSATLDAGFNLLRIISEPSAAVLAYDIGQSSSETFNCIVYCLGGNSLSVTLVQVLNGVYRILDSVECKNYGGHLFTKVLAEYCAGEFKRQYKADIMDNSRTVIKLKAACETCKHTLSTVGSAQCFVESVYDGIDLSVTISRARFESLINPLLANCKRPVQELLERVKLNADDIRKVVLAGGSCRIPKIQQAMSDMFPSSEILSHILPDEVIAVGAAKEGSIIQDEEVEVTENECSINALCHNICVRVLEDEITEKFSIVLLAKGTPVPVVSKQKTLPGVIPRTFVQIYEDVETVIACSKEKSLASISIPCSNAEDIQLTATVVQDGNLELNFSGSGCGSKSIKIARKE